MADDRSISWMPAWVPAPDLADFEIASRTGQLPWRCTRPRPDSWQVLGDGLRCAHERLREMRIAEMVTVIDEVAARWCDPRFEPRLRARDEVAAATGFSPRAVDRSFDVELPNYRSAPLERALRRELGDPAVLDGFCREGCLDGSTMAIGPRITLAVLTGNVPGLPALSVVRALLAKSAVLAKVASGEPTFAARFVRTLADADPRLGDAIAVTYWGRDDEASLQAALDQADAVIAYGSEDACASVRARLSPRHRYVEHGHKLSVGIVSRAYLQEVGAGEVARRIAADASTHNQHACIAPQAYLVEGDLASVRDFASTIAHAMDAYAQNCPLGTLDEAEAAALQLRRSTDAWLAATRSDCDLWHTPRMDWTVVLGADLSGITGAGNRVLRVVPAAGMNDAIARVTPIARYLQNVGLGVTALELGSAAEALARLGACRICEPGRMAEPSMAWRHDGTPCIAALLRWCDIEMHRAVEQDRSGAK